MLTGYAVGIERRNSPRRPLRVRVAVMSPAGTFGGTLGRMENLSASGILILLKPSIARGSSVELLFEMPASPWSRSRSMHCVGKVVRVEPFADRHATAVALEQIDVVS